MAVTRMRYSGRTLLTTGGGSGPALGAALCSEPACRIPRRARRRGGRGWARGCAWSIPQRSTHRGLELVEGRRVVAERLQVFERRLAEGTLCVEEVDEAHAASAVGGPDRVRGFLAFRGIGWR